MEYKNLKINNDICIFLKSYVYLYIDPRDNQLFYIGKGVGNRLFSHLDDDKDSNKNQRIADIRKAGKEPVIDFLRYGLTDLEATLVEASAIDLVGLKNLTNIQSGHHARSYGRISSKEIIMMLTAKPIEVTHKAILITINKLYRSNMSASEILEATRGIWKIGKRREKAEYAMAIFQGIVREVFSVQSWHKAGTLNYEWRDFSNFKGSGRWEFEGHVAEDIREMYIGKSVGKSGQNPIQYKNI